MTEVEETTGSPADTEAGLEEEAILKVPAPGQPTIWRIRDLDRRARWVAAGVGLALFLIPIFALVLNANRWYPQADDALIELRAREVGTQWTPLIGQPSTSGMYGEGGTHVAHPGPAGFYVMVPGLHLAGPVWGALGSMAIVAGCCLLITAWVAFRRAGPWIGLGAAVLAAAAAFSTGAGGLLDPLSSNAGRLPLLAAAVLVWALLDGDLRLAPLAALVWSYGAQQHLSILPAAALVVLAGVAACAWWLWRPDPVLVGSRARASLWVGAAVLTGLVMWSPVLIQEVTGDPGNLTALRTYSGDGERENLGLRRATDQVSHVLGPRPFLGRSGPDGWDLAFNEPGASSTLVLVGNLAALGGILLWTRRRNRLSAAHRRTQAAAVVMLGVLVAAGLATGANVPDSIEQGRLNFYHWAFSLSFFHLLVFGWAAVLLLLAAWHRWGPAEPASGAEPLQIALAPRFGAVAGGAVIVLSLVVGFLPWQLDRSSDWLVQSIGVRAVREFTEAVVASPALAEVDGPIVVLSGSNDAFVQLADTVAVRMRVEGHDARLPLYQQGFMHPDHLMETCDAPHVLLVSRWWPGDEELPGQVIVDIDAVPDLDMAALDRLIASAEGQKVVLGDDLTEWFDRLPAGQGPLAASALTFNLGTRSREVLTNRGNLDALIAHPPVSPELDVDDLRAVRDALEPGAMTIGGKQFRAHLATAEEYRAWRATGKFPCAKA